MSSTTANQNPHFAYGDYDVFRHRPHKTLYHFWNALAATAVFRIWPSLLFIGGWSTMVVLVNKLTSVKLEFPNTMITVLGVLLGLTLSYRTSSGYEKYSEGRKMWSQITLASRGWARTVWLHCKSPICVTKTKDPLADQPHRPRLCPPRSPRGSRVARTGRRAWSSGKEDHGANGLGIRSRRQALSSA